MTVLDFLSGKNRGYLRFLKLQIPSHYMEYLLALYQHGFEASRKFSYFLPQNNKLADHFCEHSDKNRQRKTR